MSRNDMGYDFAISDRLKELSPGVSVVADAKVLVKIVVGRRTLVQARRTCSVVADFFECQSGWPAHHNVVVDREAY